MSFCVTTFDVEAFHEMTVLKMPCWQLGAVDFTQLFSGEASKGGRGQTSSFAPGSSEVGSAWRSSWRVMKSIVDANCPVVIE
ncbi:hypothetical protein A6X21_11060 [Planctopirus hydrillae]|uniref:Uncharacterized protein n=1 Tax=Planctopirus hydrillae TaxID=1841610 RepID=A0A1C3E6B4_9PLAN|nr:hypothetical protein A6X21_11060 [Planctopirus hydrillae]